MIEHCLNQYVKNSHKTKKNYNQKKKTPSVNIANYLNQHVNNS